MKKRAVHLHKPHLVRSLYVPKSELYAVYAVLYFVCGLRALPPASQPEVGTPGTAKLGHHSTGTCLNFGVHSGTPRSASLSVPPSKKLYAGGDQKKST